jgi:hypothetical protein
LADVSNEHATGPDAALITALRVWRRCVGAREIVIPTRGRSYFDPGAHARETEVDNRRLAVWALVRGLSEQAATYPEASTTVWRIHGALIEDRPLASVSDLVVLADALQSAGDSLGEAIALEIAGLDERLLDLREPETVYVRHVRSLTKLLMADARRVQPVISAEWIHRTWSGPPGESFAATRIADAIAGTLSHPGSAGLLSATQRANVIDANRWMLGDLRIDRRMTGSDINGRLAIVTDRPVNDPTLPARFNGLRLAMSVTFCFQESDMPISDVAVEFTPLEER